MSPRVQLLSILASVALVAIVVDLVRRKKLSEGYSVLWLALCAGGVLVAVWNEGFFRASRALGIASAVSLLVFLLGGLSALYFLHLSARVSALREENRELVQWVGLLQNRVERLESAPGAEDPGPGNGADRS